MHDQSKLLQYNPQLQDSAGIFQDVRDRFRPSSVSNGLQISIGEVYQAAADKSLFSIDIERLCNTDQLRTELDASAANFLLSIDFTNIEQCLDLSEDFGGIAHYLSSHVGHVDAVRSDPDRARLSAQRCSEINNLCLISEAPEKIKFPTNHYDLIVLTDLEILDLDSDQRVTLLAKLRESLSDTGHIIVGSENDSQLRRWLSPKTSNAIPFDQFYTVADKRYSRASLLTDFDSAGLSSVNCFSSFSQGRRISNLFSDQYLASDSALNHFYRIGTIGEDEVCEYLAFKQVANSGYPHEDQSEKLSNAASRFIICAAKDTKAPVLLDLAFAHYPGGSRKPQWRTITEHSGSSSIVSKRPLHKNAAGYDKHKFLSQDLSDQEYQAGRLMITHWLDTVLGGDEKQLQNQVQEYRAWLRQLNEELGDVQFAKIAYDLLPFNLIEQVQGDANNTIYIDPEWQLDLPYNDDFILFRALYWFAFENKSLLKALCTQLNLPTIAHFITHFHPSLSRSEQLEEFANLEEKVQAEIDNQFRAGAVLNALGQHFDTNSSETVDDGLVCQIQWGDASGRMDEAGARFISWTTQPEHATRLNCALPAKPDWSQVLRIDPIANRGLFKIESITLLTANGESALKLGSASACIKAAELRNIEVAEDGETCIALNADPHLLFDVSEQPEIDTAVECRLTISLLHDHHYQGALNKLTNSLQTERQAVQSQVDKINTLRAELDFSEVRLSDSVQHRQDLNQILNELQRENRANTAIYNAQLRTQIAMLSKQHAQRVRELNRKLTHLNDQLIDQIRHNHEVDRYLMQRPLTRAKRVLGRISSGALSRPAVAAPDEETLAPDESTLQSANTDINSEPKADAAQNDQAAVEPELIGQNREDYQFWVQQNTLSASEIAAAKAEIESMPAKPVFSILVPVYNTDPDYLLPMIRSVQAQIYPHWQLVLVDDCSPKKWLRTLLEIEAAKDERITVQFNEKNQGIALTSNDALNLATGNYIALLDHDDELSIDALFENAKVINARPDVGLIYSDEDKMDMQGNRLEPYFKPDYSPDLLDTNNYICHFTVIKKSVADRIGGFREGVDGSQDHDIILRAIDESGQVVHIPKILYHWRKIPGSTAVQYDSKSYAWEAGRQAVEDCLQKHDSTARVEYGSLKGTYRVFREIRGKPLVSIIIPFKDKPELLDACIGSILSKTDYRNYEIVGVSNSSEDPTTFSRMEHWAETDERVRFVEKNIDFNFSAICNYGVSQANGEYVLLLNNDVTLDGSDWLERLLEHAQRAEVGAVGGKLLYPDGRIQHAGIVAGMVGTAGHPHKFFPDSHIGYHGRLHMVYNVSAVTGAMLMVSKEKFLQVGGLDEDNLAVAYNDVDFCLKLLAAGYLNVFTPHSRGIHHESVSRGYEDTDEKLARLKAEQAHFLSTWEDFLQKGDPYYNPNLSLLNEHFSLKFAEERETQKT